jgi:hypothetical protein
MAMLRIHPLNSAAGVLESSMSHIDHLTENRVLTCFVGGLPRLHRFLKYQFQAALDPFIPMLLVKRA